MRRAQIEIAIKKFNTPNDVNVRDIFLESFGFNPWPVWVWQKGRRQWDSVEVRNRTSAWVLVRHSIAHGFDLPDKVQWLKGPSGECRLTLGLLKECRRHFLVIAKKTDAAFSDHFVRDFGLGRNFGLQCIE